MPNPLSYLDAMDITVWQRRDKPLLPAECPAQTADDAEQAKTSTPSSAAPVVTPPPPIAPALEAEPMPDSLPPTMDAPPDYLHIPDAAFDDRFEPVLPEEAEVFIPEPEIDPKQQRAQAIAQLDWVGLQEKVAQCQDCTLHQQRTNTVFGVGSQQARWLIIGEAPGHDEDLQGEPFVGRAGQLLNAMLQAVGVQREQVYIANTVKCRPPKNRNPDALEMETCAPYLQRQIALLQPALIVLIGRVAIQQVLHSEEAVGRLRGRVHHHAESQTPVVVSYHPAYLLRRPSEKAKVWQDLQLACQTAAPSKASAD